MRAHSSWHASGRLAGQALLVVMVLSAPAIAQDPPAEVDPFFRSRQISYERQVAAAAGLEKLEPTHLKEVFSIRTLEGKGVELATPGLDALFNQRRTGRFRLELKDLPGVTTVDVGPVFNRRVPRRLPPGPNGAAAIVLEIQQTRIFSVSHIAMSGRDTIIETTVRSNAGSFNISQRKTWGHGGEQTVDLEQQQSPLRDEDFLSLRIRRTDPQAGRPIFLNLRERDVETLVRMHPVEVDQYLRPLLRELGQDSLLPAADAAAAQVLADLLPVDGAAKDQVAELLPFLDDLDFRVRDRALHNLSKLNLKGIAALRALDRKTLSPEQNRAVDLVLAPYNKLPEKDVVRLREDKTFLADCLMSDEINIRRAAIAQLKKVTGRDDLEFDPAAPVEERADALRRLRIAMLAKE